mgnify:FL=1|tara:strand:+ start:1844 stop:2659 length:816 start_codon:yes stop_codon:yes gene_type:complete
MIKYPEIDPVAISIPLPEFLHSTLGESLNIYWYGIAYVVSAYLIYLRMVATKHKFGISASKEEVSDVVFTYGLFLGVIIGGRLGSVFFYDLHLQLQDPFYFLKIWEGGMSFHGALIGGTLSMFFYARKNNYKFLTITDWVAPQLPIALFLGRIANFINAELYGRETDVSWGMIFPTDPMNLVRHPSQIYEAVLEGIVLFIFLNYVIRSAEKVGRKSAYFLIGYGVARSIAEIFRTPDLVWGNDFLLFSFLTQGQLLSIPMILLGVFILSRK